MQTAKDLDRQLIKSDSASVKVVELDFEIPPKTQKEEKSTIEDILKTAAKNLSGSTNGIDLVITVKIIF